MDRRTVRLRLATAIVAGVAAGLSIIAFRVSNAASYLSDAPETCINCHVMNSFYAGWAHGSHGTVAVCNDCHVPHENVARKIFFKGMDGSRHSFYFTFRLEPQVMRMNPGAVPVIYKNCVRCHERQVMLTSMASSGSDRLCWDCHRETPHGRALSLSSAPWAHRPALPSAGMPPTDPGERKE